MFHTINHTEPSDKKAASYLQINDCAVQPHYRGNFTLSRPKGRSDYQLICVLSGNFEASYQGKTHRMTQGFVLYPPHEPQQYSDTPDTSRIWMHFTGHQIQEILQDAKLECGVYPVILSPIIQRLLLELVAEYHQTKDVSHTKGLFLHILYLLGELQNNVGTTSDEVDDAITYIISHFNCKLQIDELAEFCNLSSSHFMHLFKEQTGTSPLAYQQTLRIKQAKSYLVTSSMSINEIAEQIGYSDPLYFSRVFKKITGLSPKDYRQKYTE